MEMERSMFKEKNFLNDYRAEAIACTTYIINRFPAKIIMNIVLEEAWSGRKKISLT